MQVGAIVDDIVNRCTPGRGWRCRPALFETSLDVSPGEVTGIVGSWGSGKSTLAKLIQRLYVPESGRVLVDGVDLAMVDIAWLRRQIGISFGQDRTKRPHQNHPAFGVVRSINVRDGQSVRAGDVLIELDPTMSEAEREHLQSDLIAAQLDVARLRALVPGRSNRIAIRLSTP
jgi:ABC-type oligopeptide transport system ATPase subunit